MFWSRGPGRIVRIAAWSLFGGCFAFGTALIWLFGQPCGDSGNGQLPLSCGSPEIAMIGNCNTLAGLCFLLIAIFATGARNTERRKCADTARQTPVGPDELVKVRLVSGKSSRPPRL